MSLPVSKLSPVVKESFVRIGDIIEIFPTFGRKRCCNLTRKSYEVRLKKGHSMKLSTCEISLPDLEGEESKYYLEIYQALEVEAFRLYSKAGRAFRLNGKYVQDAYLQYGDVVILGHNKLRFKRMAEVNSGVEHKLAKALNEKINILLEGETGVGKSYLARKIHEQSNRSGDFVHINLSGFSKGLIESELFGHVRGAFSGATTDRKGAIEQAHRGTLFIDEIDSLPKDLQVKLLLFFDSSSIRPVGGMNEKSIDVAIIISSGQQLENLLERDEMRKDFFFRISNGVTHYIKPLRNSPQAIVDMISKFEQEHEVFVTSELKDFYKGCPWPGNLRQLKGHLVKKKFYSEGRSLFINEIDYKLMKMPVELSCDDNVIPFRVVKQNYYRKVFWECQRDYALTARKLDISITSLKSNLPVE
jgi:transcriptional regulator with PAS, ATPase and Fis domain